MKKLLLLFTILALVMLLGCKKKERDLMDEVTYFEMENCDMNLEEIEFPVDLTNIYLLEENNGIDSKEDAIDIGKKIIGDCHESETFTDYELLAIVHYKQENLWRFEYSLDQRNKTEKELIDCGCLYVLIDGENGVLIKAWVEE